MDSTRMPRVKLGVFLGLVILSGGAFGLSMRQAHLRELTMRVVNESGGTIQQVAGGWSVAVNDGSVLPRVDRSRIVELEIRDTGNLDLGVVSHCGRLQVLKLYECDGLRGIDTLARLPLRHLRLMGSVTWTDRLELPSLGLLDVSESNLPSIALLPNAPNLIRLDVANTQLRDLRGLEKFPLLERLDVSRTGVRSLEYATPLVHLKELALRSCKLTSLDGVPQNLRHLDLSYSVIDDGVYVRSFPKLDTLLLASTKFCDVPRIELLPSLRHLNLRNTRVTWEKVRHLPKYARLETLEIYRVDLSLDQESELRRDMPNCIINDYAH